MQTVTITDLTNFYAYHKGEGMTDAEFVDSLTESGARSLAEALDGHHSPEQYIGLRAALAAKGY